MICAIRGSEGKLHVDKSERIKDRTNQCSNENLDEVTAPGKVN